MTFGFGNSRRELEYGIQIIDEAFQVHDRECCSESKPCGLRRNLKTKQDDQRAQLARIVDREEKRTADTDGGFVIPEASHATRGTNDGYNRGVLTITEPQFLTIKRMADGLDLDLLPPLRRDLLKLALKGISIPRKSASDLISAMMALDVPRAAPLATGPQVDTLRRLGKQKGREFTDDELHTMTKKDAGVLIDRLIKQPNVQINNVTTQVTEEGLYRDSGGRIYKVQKSRGSDNLYAMLMLKLDEPVTLRNGDVRTYTFEMAKGAIFSLTPSMKLGLEDAQRFGRATGTCCCCGLTLRKQESINDGIGPVCKKKRFGL